MHVIVLICCHLAGMRDNRGCCSKSSSIVKPTWMATKQLFGDVAALSFIAVDTIEDNSMNSLKSSSILYMMFK